MTTAATRHDHPSHRRRPAFFGATLVLGLIALLGLLPGDAALAAVADLERDIPAGVRWASDDGFFWESQVYVSGDFDDDGRDDVARVWATGDGVTNIDTFLSSGASFTSSRWANGVGGFWAGQHYLAADFDGDGRDDIARIFGDGGLTSVDVLLSTGSSFTYHRWLTRSGAFSGGMSWAVGDFDGNGLADVARIFEEVGNTSIDILLSNAEAFTAARWRTRDGGHYPGMHFVAGDFDGDGSDDVAKVWNWAGEVAVDLYRSTGAAFAPFAGTGVHGRWGLEPVFAAGDFDDDGIADIAVLNRSPGSSSGSLAAAVLLADGTGFARHALFDAHTRSSRFLVGDYDDDGKTEIAGIDGRFALTDLEVYGGPTPAWEYDAQALRWQTGSGRWALDQHYVAGDFDGDGDPDMARVFGEAGWTSVDVHSNTGAGFEYARWATQQGSHWPGMVFFAGDVDGDGDDDILKVFEEGGATSVDVFLGGPAGFTYQRWLSRNGGHYPAQKFVAGDFDGDGRTDLAKIWAWDDLATFDVYLSAGTHLADFTNWAARDGGFWITQQYVAGDYTGDGQDDIARVYNHGGLTTIEVFTSEGSFFSQRGWLSRQQRAADGQRHVSGDFDGDGHDDIVKVAANPDSQVVMSIFRSDGTNFTGHHFLEAETGFVAEMKAVAADFDLDGRAEVATAYNTAATIDTHFDVYGGDTKTLPSSLSSPGDAYPYTVEQVKSNLDAQGYTLRDTGVLKPGECTIVYPSTDEVGDVKHLGIMACAHGVADVVEVEWHPVYGGCDVAAGGGECKIGIFAGSLAVDLGGNVSAEMEIRGPSAAACAQVSRDAVCADTTATLWEGSFLITDGSGNGGGVGAYAGVGAGIGTAYQGGVLSGSANVGLGAGVEIQYSVNLGAPVVTAVGVGGAGFSYTQEGVDEAVVLGGDLLDAIDDPVNEVVGTIGDAVGTVLGGVIGIFDTAGDFICDNTPFC